MVDAIRMTPIHGSGEKLCDNEIARKALLTAKQIAALLSINENQLYKLVRSGKIPAMKLGRALRFQWDEVIDKIRSQSCPM